MQAEQVTSATSRLLHPDREHLKRNCVCVCVCVSVCVCVCVCVGIPLVFLEGLKIHFHQSADSCERREVDDPCCVDSNINQR